MLDGVARLLACEAGDDSGEEPRRDPAVRWEWVDELEDTVRWRDKDCVDGGGPDTPTPWAQTEQKSQQTHTLPYSTETYMGGGVV